MNLIQKIFNIIGWVSFLLLVPIFLSTIGITGPEKFMQTNLGKYAEPPFLLVYFYALMVLRIFFGSDKIISPLLISWVFSFLLLATVVKINFLQWYWELTGKIAFLSNKPLTVLVAVIVILAGILFSSLKKFPLLLQLLVLVVIPIAFLVAADIFKIVQFGNLHLQGK
ncbi:MAG: hypothetical protein AB1798_08915 [Spirochaetota bacterium]